MCLLLLRVVFGLAVLGEGRFYVTDHNPSPVSWILGLSAFAAGGLLIVGFLMPVVGTAVTAVAIGIAFSVIPAALPTLFSSKIAVAFGGAILVSITGLGPGAFSVDARLFGRREIIIPPPFNSLEE